MIVREQVSSAQMLSSVKGILWALDLVRKFNSVNGEDPLDTVCPRTHRVFFTVRAKRDDKLEGRLRKYTGLPCEISLG